MWVLDDNDYSALPPHLDNYATGNSRRHKHVWFDRACLNFWAKTKKTFNVKMVALLPRHTLTTNLRP
jgi:hypothetical protein